MNTDTNMGSVDQENGLVLTISVFMSTGDVMDHRIVMTDLMKLIVTTI